MVGKLTAACIFALAICSGIPGLAYADGWADSGLCNYRRYGLDAGKFFLYITKDTPYTSWQTWPEKTKTAPAGGPHGAFHTTYVNPVAYASIIEKEGMKFGSVIVMESFGPDKEPAHIYAKLRIKGYDPESGDWYWFKFGLDGKALAEGKDESCLACHRKKNER